MDLKTLYREVILDHYKKPRNAGELEAPDRQARCKNPSCGDRITLQIKLDGDRIAKIGYIGSGCAISQASTSMMTQAIMGKSIAEAQEVLREFRGMIVEGNQSPNKDILGDLITMEGVGKLHARVKCAMCGWSALEATLEDHGDEIDMDHDSTMPSSKRGGI